jgi:hypothetical protein
MNIGVQNGSGTRRRRIGECCAVRQDLDRQIQQRA